MTKYVVNSELSDTEWQSENSTARYRFIADNGDKTGGPDPVEYLTGALNSCMSISAGLLIKAHHLDVQNFKINAEANTERLSHGMPDVDTITIKISFDSPMSHEDQDKFVKDILRVSTVYQTLKKAIKISIEWN